MATGFSKMRAGYTGKVQRINEIHQYSIDESFSFPTDLKRFQDNILFSKIIIPTGLKNSGNVMSLTELNERMIKKGFPQVSEKTYSKMVDDLYKAVKEAIGGITFRKVRSYVSKTTNEAFSIAEEQVGFDFGDWQSIPQWKLNEIYKYAKANPKENGRYPVFEIMQEMIDEYYENKEST